MSAALVTILLCIGYLVFTIDKKQEDFPVTVVLLLIGIGLSFSGIYPLTMAHAHPIIRGSGIATALVISGGGLGSTIVPYISGRIADRYGTVSIIATILMTLICMFVFSMINERKNAQRFR